MYAATLPRFALLVAACTLFLVASTGAPRSVSASATASAITAKPAALTAVDSVDLAKYTGKWYEVARYDNRWQRDTVNVIAHYSLYPNGTLKLENSARQDSLTGKVKDGTGRGWVTKGSNNAKWRVRFVWPFKADYWIIDLCPDYQWAVVGQPSRDNLWILSRTPTLDEEITRGIHARLRDNGYDPAKLITTLQPADGPTFAPGGGIVEAAGPEASPGD